MEFIALVHPAEAGGYWADFPDLPGCFTQGETMEDVRRMAEDALSIHVDVMRSEGMEIPKPSTLDAIMAGEGTAGAMAMAVHLRPFEREKVRVNISLYKDELEEMDRYADAHGLTRSGFIAKAAKTAMQGG